MGARFVIGGNICAVSERNDNAGSPCVSDCAPGIYQENILPKLAIRNNLTIFTEK